MFNNAIGKTSICVALTLAFSANAMAVTEIPFWHSMEGELGVEVNSLADRFNQSHSDYKIVPVYKGNYEQSLAAGIAAFRSGKAPAILQVYEVGTATMMASKAIKPVSRYLKTPILILMNRFSSRRLRVITLMPKPVTYYLSHLTAPRRCCITTKMLSKKQV
ncbi:sn-glycerol-3-phosphate-binding periplasmic protein ugpB [Yersinia aldovae ATCC 35236]|nr:sn-glycerol-3-phosphate-binding periplasmic protein ugpB [Yersinia aldovae ATCC 35236]